MSLFFYIKNIILFTSVGKNYCLLLIESLLLIFKKTVRDILQKKLDDTKGILHKSEPTRDILSFFYENQKP